MPIRAKLIGTATALGTVGYYQSRTPTRLDSRPPRAELPTPHVTTTSLSAYDKKEESVYLIPEAPTELQGYITQTRKHVIMAIDHADMAARAAVDKVVATEYAIEHTIKSLAPKNGMETLLPGAIYVSIIGLSGSIIARNRALPIRFITPLLLFTVSARLILPETSRNVGNLIYELESKVPAVKQVHDETRSKVAAGLWKAGEVVEDAEHILDGAVQGSKDVFEKTSGIKLPK